MLVRAKWSDDGEFAVLVQEGITLDALQKILQSDLQVDVDFCDFNAEMVGCRLLPEMLLDADSPHGGLIHIIVSGEPQFPRDYEAPGPCTQVANVSAGSKPRDGAPQKQPARTRADGTAAKDISCILDGVLYVGGNLAASSKWALQDVGITHVLNCCERIPCKFRSLCKYHVLHIHDTQSADIIPCVTEGIEFIDAARGSGGRCLVHCMVGASRSVSVVLGYLMATEKMSLQEAYRLCRSRRQAALPNKSFCLQLVEYEQAVTGTKTMTNVDDFKRVAAEVKEACSAATRKDKLQRKH